MKNTIYILITTVVILLTSCVEGETIPQSVPQQSFVLNLGNIGGRVCASGNNDNPDFKLKGFLCYVYNEEDGKIKFTWRNNDFDFKEGKYIKRLRLKDYKYFNTIRPYKVFVVANFDIDDATKKTDIQEVRNIEIQDNDNFETVESLVMVGDGDIKQETATEKYCQCNVQLHRLAAKLELKVSDDFKNSKDNELKNADVKYEEMKATLYRSVNKTKMEGVYNISDKDIVDQNDKPFKKTEGEKYRVDFYSYPANWNDDIDREMFVNIKLPVTIDGTPRTYYYKILVNDLGKMLLANHLYKIDVKLRIKGSLKPEIPVEVKPNLRIMDWTDVDSNVDLENVKYLVINETEVKVHNEDYVLIPYASSHPCESEVLDIKVQNTKAKNAEFMKIEDLDNEDPLKIKYNQGKLKPCEVTFIDNDKSYIMVSHEMMKGDDKEDEYRPYIINIKINHIGDENMSENIKVIQYPAQYIVAECNSGNIGTTIDTTTVEYRFGYVYIAGYRAWRNTSNDFDDGLNWEKNLPDNDYWRLTADLNEASTKNKNFNTYLISVSDIDTSKEKYIIGDPTTTEGDVLYLIYRVACDDAIRFEICEVDKYGNIKIDENDEKKLPVIHWENLNKLKIAPGGQIIRRYRQTRHDSEAQNIVAPKIRVASSHGATSENTQSNCELRCACYQEDGRPAGRWRVPTKAEIEYIISLSNKGRIPPLFTINETERSGYWCGQGRMVWKNGRVEFEKSYSFYDRSAVRCVYDEWYWGSEKTDREKFTWGEEQISIGDLIKNYVKQ